MVRVDETAGGVVLNDGRVAVILQDGKFWSLPKGKLERNESFLSAARREVFEETGLSDLVLIRKLGEYNRHKMNVDGSDNPRVVKHIVMFLFKTGQSKFSFSDGEVTDARWVPVDSVEELLAHVEDKAFFKRVKKVLYPYC